MAWRDRKFPVILMLYLLSQVLYASSTVNIGWVAVDRVGSKSLVNEVFEVVGSNLVQNFSIDPYVPLVRDRLAQAAKLDELKIRHDAIIAADGDTTRVDVNSEERDMLVEGVQWNRIDLPRELESPLSKGDPIIFRYVMDRWDLDVFLVGVLEPYDVLYRLRIVEYRSDGKEDVIHSALSVSESIPSMVSQAIASTIDRLSANSLGVVELKRSVPGLEIDGIPFDGYLVKKSGTHKLTLTASGYEAQEMIVEVESSRVATVDIEMEKRAGAPLLVTSESGGSTISIPRVVEQQVPFVWQSRETPFNLYAEESGFKSTHLMYDDVGKEIVLSFEPIWMNPVHGTKRMQDEVYASLGRTLVAAALAVVIDSVSQTVVSYSGDRVVWQPVLLGAVGATAVSAFDTLARLFAYYQKTKYSSR